MAMHEEQFMDEALRLAQIAGECGDVPIGAVIVDEHGSIIGSGYNRVEAEKSQTLHAELLALAEAAKAKGDWRLEKCWLYVTLEPCLMCVAALGLSRLAGVTYAAASPEFGGVQYVDCSRKNPYLGQLLVVGGLKENESVGMLKTFFKHARGEEYREPTPGVSRESKSKS